MPGICFAEVRARVTMAEVLGLVGFVPRETSGDQVRGPCPVHHSASPAYPSRETPWSPQKRPSPLGRYDLPRGRLCGPANEFYSRSESATPDPSGNDREAEPPPPASNRPRNGPDARSAVGGQSSGLAGVGPVVAWPVRRTLTKWRRPARRRSWRLGRDLAYGRVAGGGERGSADAHEIRRESARDARKVG